METPDARDRSFSPQAFLKGSNTTLNRLGFGAMQLAGPRVWGPPDDRDAAIGVLRQAVSLGVTHIDTSDYYGPHVVNELIREALHPYPEHLTIVTKVGARRSADKRWPAALSRDDLVGAVTDNLRNLRLDALDVVNLRVGTPQGPQQASIAEPFDVLARLQKQGLIRHLGLSNVTQEQVAECQAIAQVVCVQNRYNVACRQDDALVDSLASQGIPYVPYNPLGGINPIQSSTLNSLAQALDASPMQLALAWLLHRSPNILPIPGTSSIAHLKENMAAGRLRLSGSVMVELDRIGIDGLGASA
jgi:aryl-alcohol dehydrogenase-like predicted oxidoreductase